MNNIPGNDIYSLKDVVFNKLREAILTGRFKEGDELRENALSKEFNVSRTPVREALKQLDLEGLIKIIPNKGAFVVGMNNKDFKDIYIIRGRLEGLCARWATENATNEDISKLEEIVDLTEYHASKGKYENVFKLDNEFHLLLYKMSDSRILSRTLTDFHHYLESIRMQTLSNKDRVLNSVREHKNIINAIKAGDCDLAESCAIEHMKNTIENIKAHDIL